MKGTITCISCHKPLTNSQGSTIFSCPQCGKTQIVRCYACRQIAARYECPECQFSGPN
ncbi:MAG: zinc finger domain-containing protein [Nanoarchaeota archaeon]